MKVSVAADAHPGNGLIRDLCSSFRLARRGFDAVFAGYAPEVGGAEGGCSGDVGGLFAVA